MFGTSDLANGRSFPRLVFLVNTMAARGYGCILLRDATAAIEHSETVDRQLNAKAVVDQVELRFGYSALTDDFIRACKLHRGRSSKK